MSLTDDESLLWTFSGPQRLALLHLRTTVRAGVRHDGMPEWSRRERHYLSWLKWLVQSGRVAR